MKQETLAKMVQPMLDALISSIGMPEEKWECPWRRIKTASRSVKGRAYTGANAMYCMVDRWKNPNRTPVYATFKQWQEAGMQVREGEKAIMLSVYSAMNKPDRNDSSKEVMVRFSRPFFVFNSTQLTEEYVIDPSLSVANAIDVEIEARILKDASFIQIHHGGNRAAYSPSLDEVYMPNRVQFYSDASYWGTLLHELTHATGHESRLKRVFGKEFGDDDYAFEELVAELGSYLASVAYGIATDPKPESISYLRNWASKIQESPEVFTKAASAAQKAVTFLMPAKETSDEPEMAVVN